MIERYGELKKILITVRDTPLGLTDEQVANLRDAIVNIGHMEKTVERTLEDSTETPPVGQMNTIMANNVESLQELLVAIRQADGGRHAAR